MSLVSDMIGTAAVPQHLAMLGQAAVYTSAAGVTTACTVLVGNQREEEEETPQGRCWRQVCSMWLQTSAVAAPDARATITLDGQVWAIEAIEEQNEAYHRVRCVFRSPVEVSRPGLRGRP